MTLGAALVQGGHGIIGKILALPEFIVVIVLARLAGMALRARKLPVLRTLLVVKVILLIGFFALATGFGPFPDANTPAALLTGFAGIAAMAVQNAVQRVHLPALPPTTLMTGTTTQATLDAVDLLTGVGFGGSAPQSARDLAGSHWRSCISPPGARVRRRLSTASGFWCLAVPAARRRRGGADADRGIGVARYLFASRPAARYLSTQHSAEFGEVH